MTKIRKIAPDTVEISWTGPNLEKKIRQELHDTISAIRTLTMAAEEISEGYRFDDAIGNAKIASLSKAAHTLQNAMRSYEAILRTLIE